jgi:hypothetical protein
MSTLKQVGQKALAEPKFFEELVAQRGDPQPTLSKYGMSLDQRDLGILIEALKEPAHRGDFNLVEFIQRIHKLPGGHNPFSGWDPDWVFHWVAIPGQNHDAN